MQQRQILYDRRLVKARAAPCTAYVFDDRKVHGRGVTADAPLEADRVHAS